METKKLSGRVSTNSRESCKLVVGSLDVLASPVRRWNVSSVTAFTSVLSHG